MGKKLLHSFCSKKIEIIEFLADDGIVSEVEGSSPLEYPNGQPNITYIAKFKSKKERDDLFNSMGNDPEWEKVWSKHPNPNAYVHSYGKFFKSIKKNN
jgi:hypothetical protein|tara:strand:- start:526 stop:819 length:294 start_codon:yes stop_codon:yes gene_type:complete